MSNEKWYVSLGDGTFVELDERPYVFLATEEQITILDSFWGGEAPIDCTDDGIRANMSKRGVSQRLFESHIHIKDLVEHSHWEEGYESPPPKNHEGHKSIV